MYDENIYDEPQCEEVYQDEELYEDENSQEEDGEPAGSYDLTDDGDALASAGHGMDEDYYLDSSFEERYDYGE